MTCCELTSSTDENGVYSVKHNDRVIAYVDFCKDPQSNDVISYWNDGVIIVGHYCRWYPKAAKKRRVLKKWVRRFNAVWSQVSYPELKFR